jgi:hypothetical protein
MCINANASISTFIFSIVSSFILIYFGNKKYQKENLTAGLSFIYVAFMQIYEYFFWIDLDNKKGYNKISTLFASFFNYTQPTAVYLAKEFVFKQNNIYITIINIAYFIYFLFMYKNYIDNGDLITRVKHKHLYWGWIKHFDFIPYTFVLFLNIFTTINIRYSLVLFFTITTLYLLSYLNFKENVGAFWCFFVAYLPIFLCVATYFF